MMNLQQFAEKYELTPTMMTNPVQYFVQVFAILSRIHEALTSSSERKSSSVAKAVEEVEKMPETVSATDNLAAALRNYIFTAIEQDENISVLLPKVLKEITSEVTEVRKLAMSGIEIPEDEPEEDTEEEEAMRAEAICAVKILREQPATVLAMSGLSFSDLPEKMVGKRKDGSEYVKLPKGFSEDALSKGKANGAKGAGRPISTSNWTFTLNDEKLPVVPIDVLAVRFCSTTTARISGTELREWYSNRTGKDFPAPPEDGTVTIPVPKGTLIGTFTKSS